jgi:drug/metabolite transporter (DMT)-like permease
MSAADLALVAANLVYATSYVVTRVALDDVPPATLALLRVGLAAAVLLPLARAAVFLNLQPVVGAVLGVAVLDEPAGLLTAAGAALVVAGLALTTHRAPH